MEAGEVLVLHPSGGSGQHLMQLLGNASGATFDPSTGVYVAGAAEGGEEAIDRISLSDRGCVGEAGARIAVLPPARVLPERSLLRPGQGLRFVVEGGRTGEALRLLEAGAGGQLDEEGRYLAGPRAGRDRIGLVTPDGGVRADATVEVRADGGLALSPARWWLPLGARMRLPVTGGSGSYRIVTGERAVGVEAEVLTGLSPGEARIGIEDRFTGERIEARVGVVAPSEAPRRLTRGAAAVQMVAPGDLDGDGHPDLVVGLRGATVARHQSGALLIFRGVEGGLAREPARVIAGRTRLDALGAALAVADLDRDGWPDLIVASTNATRTANLQGVVEIYRGAPGRFFEEAPAQALLGLGYLERFGTSLAVADFNGDGELDLAVGAPYAEELGASRELRTRGAVRLFLGRGGGLFVSQPDQSLFPWVPGPEGGARWEAFGGRRFGEDLAAGDFDGDGRDDLAVHSEQIEQDRPGDGGLALYLGAAPVGLADGGLVAEPALVLGPSEGPAKGFGGSVALEDLDGDGRAELVIGHPGYGPEEEDFGELLVLTGRAPEGSAEAILRPEVASLRLEGEVPGASLARGFAFGDFEGDGLRDLILGLPGERFEGRGTQVAELRVYSGRAGAFPAAAPSALFTSLEPGDQLGQRLALLGDLDGDGLAELALAAPGADVEAPDDDLGRIYLRRSGGALEELSIPYAGSGQELGETVRWVGDLDGDGLPELAVGAHEADQGGVESAGDLHLYAGRASGASEAPIRSLGLLAIGAVDDHLGQRITGPIDFDGDGRLDLATRLPVKDMPSEFPVELAADEQSCGGALPVEGRRRAGALLVYRGGGPVEPGRPAGLGAEPAFLYFGPRARGNLRGEIGRADLDGDGRGDLILGATDWDGRLGGLVFVRGRAADPLGRPLLICEPDAVLDGLSLGLRGGARLGEAIAGLGDLDGDGCEEWAAGAPRADPSGDQIDAGAILVGTGFGAGCAREAPALLWLEGPSPHALLGSALSGEADLDGDGLRDLVAGEPGFNTGEGQIGRASVALSGPLRALLLSGVERASFFVASPGRHAIVTGSTPGAELGSAVAAVADPSGVGGWVAVGEPGGSAGGWANTGGVVLYRFLPGEGFSEAPSARLAGEGAQGFLGAFLSATAARGRILLAAGAPWSSAARPDDGASYAWSFDPSER